EPWPWTDDPILRDGKFCHVERERDRTTRWITEHWRNPHADDPDLIVALAIARRINHVPTLSELGYPLPWSHEIGERLIARRERGDACSDQTAYRTLAGCPPRMLLVEGFAHVLFPALWASREFLRPHSDDICQAVHARLMALDGWGDFLAAQVIADLKFVRPLRDAPDFMTFVVSGPGSRRGLNEVLGRPPNTPWRSEAAWHAEFKKLHEAVIRPEAARRGIDLSAPDGQNGLCEFSKFIKWSRTWKPGRRYVPASDRAARPARKQTPKQPRPVVPLPTEPAPALPVTYRRRPGAPVLFRDFETRSAADLTRVGAWRYAADPTTEMV